MSFGAGIPMTDGSSRKFTADCIFGSVGGLGAGADVAGAADAGAGSGAGASVAILFLFVDPVSAAVTQPTGTAMESPPTTHRPGRNHRERERAGRNQPNAQEAGGTAPVRRPVRPSRARPVHTHARCNESHMHKLVVNLSFKMINPS